MAIKSRKSTQHERVRRADLFRGAYQPDRTKVHTASLHAWQARQAIQHSTREDWRARARRYSRYSPWTAAGFRNALKRAEREEKVGKFRAAMAGRPAVPSLSDMLTGRPLDPDGPTASLPSAPDFSMENMHPASGSCEGSQSIRIASIAGVPDTGSSDGDRGSVDVDDCSETEGDERHRGDAGELHERVGDFGQLINNTLKVEAHVHDGLCEVRRQWQELEKSLDVRK